MSLRNVTYYFGRLNIIATYTNKNAFILEALRSSKIFQYRQSSWGFFEIETHDNGSYCSGWLAKYKPSAIEEVALPEQQALGGYPIPNLVSAKSRFFLHLDSGLVGFHPVTPDIPKEVFTERFCSCLENAYDKLLVSAEITFVEDEYEILEVLKTFSSIRQIDISLHPSNPSNRDLWKSVDERLRRLRATKYIEQYETNRPDGSLEAQSDAEIRSKITMAIDGYGRASVSGVVDGKQKTITTEDNPVTEEAQGDSAEAKFVLETLKAAFDKIMRRFVK